MPDRFEKRLEHGPPVVTDGAMGVLVSSAVPGLRCPEEANIRAPESVVSLHASFINAGAELIETNTFGANRHKLRSQFLEDEELGAQLVAVGTKRVGLDQLCAGVDEAGVQGDDALRGADVRLLRTAQAGDGARDEHAHGPV